MGRSHKVQLLFFFSFLLLSTLVERRCCKIQATLLQNKKRCQSKSCQKLYFSSAWVRVGPVYSNNFLCSGRVLFSLWCYESLFKPNETSVKNKCAVLNYYLTETSF